MVRLNRARLTLGRTRPLVSMLAAAAVLSSGAFPGGAAPKNTPPGTTADTGAPDQGPWQTDHFTLQYGPHFRQAAQDALPWLEHARDLDNALIGFLSMTPVVVTLCQSQDEYAKTGAPGDAAIGSAGRDGVILLCNSSTPELTAKAITRLYTRYAVANLTHRKAAAWLAVGFEGYTAGGLTPSLGLLARAGQADKLTPLGSGILPANSDPITQDQGAQSLDGETDAFTPENDPAVDGRLIPYAEGVFFVYYLERTAGARSVGTLLTDIGDGKSWQDAIHDATGRDASSIESEWMKLIRSDVRAVTPPGEKVGTWHSAGTTVPDIPGPPAPGQPAAIRLVVGDYDMGVTEHVDALLVAGGNVTIHGTVTSRIAVIGGNLTIASTGRVGGVITLIGGSLAVDPGAMVNARAELSTDRFKADAIKSDRANLAVRLNRPVDMDLRLPGQAYLMRQGSVKVGADDKLDAVMAIGGSVDVSGAMPSRVVAVGGDVTLTGVTPGDSEIAAIGGVVKVDGKRTDPGPDMPWTDIPHLDVSYFAPAQGAADPVPVYLGVGDTEAPPDQTFDAVLCLGGGCLIAGTVHGGLVIAGDATALAGSMADGQLWIYDGRMMEQNGSDTGRLVVRGNPLPAEK